MATNATRRRPQQWRVTPHDGLRKRIDPRRSRRARRRKTSVIRFVFFVIFVDISLLSCGLGSAAANATRRGTLYQRQTFNATRGRPQHWLVMPNAGPEKRTDLLCECSRSLGRIGWCTLIVILLIKGAVKPQVAVRCVEHPAFDRVA